ncbi:ATP-binding protein [Lacrimispora sp. BS-2]|uniref:ATP-binding protein n=1 Tax=Lacrimispora sp. BS-2 TaxID=3151850 RepID=A0AAU7PU00_9FIRM
MSKINDIQNGILQMEGGCYQKLLDCYLHRKYGVDNWSPLGAQLGTDKTTKGTPDAYARTEDGKYVLLMYGTVKSSPFVKIKADIESCLDKRKTGIDISNIEQIICCHTSTRLTAGENKVLHELFSNVKLVGIGELSQDLYYKYQALAKEYLNVSIDTNQILEDVEFIKKSESSAFTTPLSNQLLCREEEKNEVLDFLNSSDVVVISGKSGAGKTRLALEVGREFSKKNNYVFRCVKQNGEPIYEDLKAHFVDEVDYCVFVDDANMLAHLSHLLDICINKSRKYRTKLIITVRDYAYNDILIRIKKQVLPQTYELKPLSDNNIKEILKQEFGVLNSDCIERIVKVSGGNMRLAIMAATSLMEKKVGNLNNIIDIYDFYYQDIVDKMGRALVITGALLALFDSIRLDDSEHIIYKLAATNNISENEIKDAYFELHKLEIVDIYKDLAVKSSEQALSNYLLFLVFYKSKYIRISDAMNICFPKYRGRIVYAFNTLMNLFYSNELQQYDFSEMKKSWGYFSTKNKKVQMEFLSAFYVAVKTETLHFIKQQIEQLPEIHEDFLMYDFESKSNNENIKSEFLRMIAGFKRADEFDDAIQLLLFHLKRNTEQPMDFYFLLKSQLSIDKKSHYYNYKSEFNLLKQFIDYYHQTNSSNVAVLIIYYCKWILQFEFQSIEATSNGGISHTRFGLLDCDGIREIRDLAIEILFQLYNEESGKYRIAVLNVLKSYKYITNYVILHTIIVKVREEFFCKYGF